MCFGGKWFDDVNMLVLPSPFLLLQDPQQIAVFVGPHR